MGMDIRPARGQFEIHGDTFLVRDILKKQGGRWNGFAGAWTFDTEAAAKLAVEIAEKELVVRQELAELEAQA